MTDPIEHRDGITACDVRTARLATRVLASGREDGEPIIFLHGNLSTATFWEETMLAMPRHFRCTAPDQRGYGQADSSALVDATRGVADWGDDVIALADYYEWPQFHVIGHSLGGSVVWSLLGTSAHRVRTATVVAPGPPNGFPGAHGPRCALNRADGAGSGAGVVNPQFVARLRAGDRSPTDDSYSPRNVMNRVFWHPEFRPAREEQLLTAMLQVHLGKRQFPGDYVPSDDWPGFAPGRFGPINALSPKYNQHVLSELLAATTKRPLLWIYGNADAIINDASMSDVGQQGFLGLRQGWPGNETFPPQPLLSEVLYALKQYAAHGGHVQQLRLPNVGHTPYLEAPAPCHAALMRHFTT
ncbi:MAG: alpha/beta hydrolase [Pirellulaceae bacterium]|nr:alpha/beta hydrolase [Planctomycetales bacterium]